MTVFISENSALIESQQARISELQAKIDEMQALEMEFDTRFKAIFA